ncbi:MAG: DoxX family protein [Chitinophagaceae bacterium]|nr:MAG: DoxX family protein [Chitinophagaceae bacterium]
MTNPGLYIMIAAYLFTGIMHFIRPAGFVRIIPPYLSRPYSLVYISGAAEIILAILLIPHATRAIAAWGLIALLIAVFPANIYMASLFYRKKHRLLWLAILRLPLQALLIYWAWIYT